MISLLLPQLKATLYYLVNNTIQLNVHLIFIVKVDHTRGKLYARVGWAKRQDGSLLAPPIDQWRQYNKHKSSVEPITEVFDKFGNIDPDKLETWLINHQIDPNDPR